jgi:DNA-directed RNA polymerase subunit K/omega
MVNRPTHINAYEFAVLSALRAQQLIKGCTPRVAGTHNAPTMAQMEVAAGQVSRRVDDAVPPVTTP